MRVSAEVGGLKRAAERKAGRFFGATASVFVRLMLKANRGPGSLSSGYFSSALKTFAKHAALEEENEHEVDRPARTDGRNEIEKKAEEIIYSRVRVRLGREALS